MQELIRRICERLKAGAYVNEAAISHGIVTPILSTLGWDSADPEHLVPEYSVENGRVDFALIGASRKPVVFIEVKAVGKATDADRQLFEYAFHHGVPLCVLTDGREWSVYVPSGVGSYEDRRVYRLQLDERSPAECQQVLQRYLAFGRVRSGAAFADAQHDHQTASGRKAAEALLPKAWAELVSEAHELVVSALIEKAEALSGFQPDENAAIAFLRVLKPGTQSAPAATLKQTGRPVTPPAKPHTPPAAAEAPAPNPPSGGDKTVSYTLLGQTLISPNASRALVDILRALAQRDPSRLPTLADAVRTPRLAHIAGSPTEINPRKPEIARAVEISPGWMVGLNIDNRTKMQIIRAAAQIWELKMPEELTVEMPNT